VHDLEGDLAVETAVDGRYTVAMPPRAMREITS